MEASSGLPLSPRALLELEEEQRPLFPLVDYAELPSILPETMKKILEDEIKVDSKTVVIVDCRHNFEYEGGHIKGALNIDVPEEIENFYSKNKETGKNVVLILHCEFSSIRAPKLFRYFRNLDRLEHLETYPELAFPFVYLLHGGYKAFFEHFPELCHPKQHVKMTDPRFSEQLLESRKNMKKSWSLINDMNR